MKKYLFITASSLLFGLQAYSQIKQKKNKAIFLEEISWTTAQKNLTADAVVVIPLGAGAKEHGPHLPLSTDFIQAQGCVKELATQRKVIIAPILNYGFYPAFLQYPGSTSLNFGNATEMILSIVRSLSNYGPKRFYIINIGVSTTPTLELASRILADEGILLYFTDYSRPNFEAIEIPIRTKEFSGHADEIETSNILWLRPDLVNMSLAANDSSTKNLQEPMGPVKLNGGVVNTTGIEGYAALGTKEKGRRYMNAFTNEVIKEIDSITTCELPRIKNRTLEYTFYEGVYKDSVGNKLEISQDANTLYSIWNGIDRRSFFHLYYADVNYFTSINIQILFVKNEQNIVTKAWCRKNGISFWMSKIK